MSRERTKDFASTRISKSRSTGVDGYDFHQPFPPAVVRQTREFEDCDRLANIKGRFSAKILSC
jgi:hypothetical protein